MSVHSIDPEDSSPPVSESEGRVESEPQSPVNHRFTAAQQHLRTHFEQRVTDREALSKWNNNAEGRNQGLVHLLDYAYARPSNLSLSTKKDLTESTKKILTGENKLSDEQYDLFSAADRSGRSSFTHKELTDPNKEHPLTNAQVEMLVRSGYLEPLDTPELKKAKSEVEKAQGELDGLVNQKKEELRNAGVSRKNLKERLAEFKEADNSYREKSEELKQAMDEEKAVTLYTPDKNILSAKQYDLLSAADRSGRSSFTHKGLTDPNKKHRLTNDQVKMLVDRRYLVALDTPELKKAKSEVKKAQDELDDLAKQKTRELRNAGVSGKDIGVRLAEFKETDNSYREKFKELSQAIEKEKAVTLYTPGTDVSKQGRLKAIAEAGGKESFERGKEIEDGTRIISALMNKENLKQTEKRDPPASLKDDWRRLGKGKWEIQKIPQNEIKPTATAEFEANGLRVIGWGTLNDPKADPSQHPGDLRISTVMGASSTRTQGPSKGQQGPSKGQQGPPKGPSTKGHNVAQPESPTQKQGLSKRGRPSQGPQGPGL